ncbi:MAG TPA: hypothetical protein PLK76_02455 [bacterium]|nr:hypothetical protein [bacterium]
METDNFKKLIRSFKEFFNVFGDLVLELYHLNKIVCVCATVVVLFISWKIFFQYYWKWLLILGSTTIIVGMILNIFIKNDVYVSKGIASVLILGLIIFYGGDIVEYFIRNRSSSNPWTKRDAYLSKRWDDVGVWACYISLYLIIAMLKINFFTVLLQKINLM